jgi:hypothetical protein
MHVFIQSEVIFQVFDFELKATNVKQIQIYIKTKRLNKFQVDASYGT